MKLSIQHNKEGQSLVEVIVACGILGIVMAAMMSIAVASRNLLYQSEEQTKATTLAQEGIEIVKHQRDIGCSFTSIKDTATGLLISNTWYIKADTVPDSSPDNTSEELVSSGQGDQIQNFDGFSRTIEIYELSDSRFNGTTTVEDSNGNPLFQDGTDCGTDNDYDCREKYYFIQVKIQKGTATISEVSTIMFKE